jgi:DNA-binding NarL/FixJ family response regulator
MSVPDAPPWVVLTLDERHDAAAIAIAAVLRGAEQFEDSFEIVQAIEEMLEGGLVLSAVNVFPPDHPGSFYSQSGRNGDLLPGECERLRRLATRHRDEQVRWAKELEGYATDVVGHRRHLAEVARANRVLAALEVGS